VLFWIWHYPDLDTALLLFSGFANTGKSAKYTLKLTPEHHTQIAQMKKNRLSVFNFFLHFLKIILLLPWFAINWSDFNVVNF